MTVLMSEPSANRPLPARPGPGPAAAADIYSISRLNREAKLLLEAGLGAIWVEGEISNFSRPSSGHWYFTLKDRDAQLRCAMFRQRNVLAAFSPREGQLVLARGRVSLYEARGDFQLLVEYLEEAGIGALQRAFTELQSRLAAEGLFAPERKRSLPAVPKRVGVITSPTGAAIRDILHTLARRFPASEVLIYPAPVQGAAAAPAIVAALDLASARQECDVLILARGGGSLEDLWAFNDERVARAIARCTIPLVTGIGHEVDFTIADFVGDARAPTPTAAAQLVVPDRLVWLARFVQLQARLAAAARRQLHDEQTRLAVLAGRLTRSHPGARLMQHSQRLDELEQRLNRAMLLGTERATTLLHTLRTRLRSRSPAAALREFQLQVAAGLGRLQGAAQVTLARAQARLELAARALQTVSPLATLARGFAVLTRARDGALVNRADMLAAGEQFDAQLAVGAIRASVLARRS
jgi:exodeoxyribonuclease VII large subunit